MGCSAAVAARRIGPNVAAQVEAFSLVQGASHPPWFSGTPSSTPTASTPDHQHELRYELVDWFRGIDSYLLLLRSLTMTIEAPSAGTQSVLRR